MIIDHPTPSFGIVIGIGIGNVSGTVCILAQKTLSVNTSLAFSSFVSIYKVPFCAHYTNTYVLYPLVCIFIRFFTKLQTTNTAVWKLYWTNNKYPPVVTF